MVQPNCAPSTKVVASRKPLNLNDAKDDLKNMKQQLATQKGRNTRLINGINEDAKKLAIITSERDDRAKREIENRKSKDCLYRVYTKDFLEKQVEYNNFKINFDEAARGFVSLPSCEKCTRQYGQEEDRTPRVLECGHTICLNCVIQIFDTQKLGGRCECPFDQTQIAAGTPQTLPKNFTLLDMLP